MKMAAGANGAGKAGAAALSQGLKAQKAPARGLVRDCPDLGESWGQGGCSWLAGPQAEPPRPLPGLWGRCLGPAPDLSDVGLFLTAPLGFSRALSQM